MFSVQFVICRLSVWFESEHFRLYERTPYVGSVCISDVTAITVRTTAVRVILDCGIGLWRHVWFPSGLEDYAASVLPEEEQIYSSFTMKMKTQRSSETSVCIF
jgi:hypothetical protein